MQCDCVVVEGGNRSSEHQLSGICTMCNDFCIRFVCPWYWCIERKLVTMVVGDIPNIHVSP